MTATAASFHIPVLEYLKGDRSPRADALLRFSWMIAGSIGYALLTLATFVGAMVFGSPLVLAILPLSLVAAVGATLVKERTTRCIGLGALAGAVAFWTIGYAVGLIVMVCA